MPCSSFSEQAATFTLLNTLNTHTDVPEKRTYYKNTFFSIRSKRRINPEPPLKGYSWRRTNKTPNVELQGVVVGGCVCVIGYFTKAFAFT